MIKHAGKYDLSTQDRQKLRDFAYKYPGWKRALAFMTHTSRAQRLDQVRVATGVNGAPTETLAIRRYSLSRKVSIIESTARETDALLYPFLIRGVTEKKATYERLRADGLAVSRNTYYDRYRKFYYLLHQKDLRLHFTDKQGQDAVEKV